MLAWFKRRRELIAAEADELMEAYGNDAYRIARGISRAARAANDARIDRFYSAVAKEIAKFTGFEIGLDTATRYLDEKQAPYDPGPGMVIRRPYGSTLH
jgi:hypothetical protein